MQKHSGTRNAHWLLINFTDACLIGWWFQIFKWELLLWESVFSHRAATRLQTLKNEHDDGNIEHFEDVPPTLPETKISPENGPLEKEIPIGNHPF